MKHSLRRTLIRLRNRRLPEILVLSFICLVVWVLGSFVTIVVSRML